MPRDYRRSTPAPPPKRKQSKSCVWWLIVGVALGVVVSKILAPATEDAGAGAEPAALATAGDRPAPVKPSFRFEEILTDPEADSRKATATPAPQPRSQPQPSASAPEKPLQAAVVTAPPAVTPEPTPEPRSGTYVVQVGSFNRAADAERLKAELALLGVSTSIQAATLSNGRVTHRVRTGGFTSRQDAQKIQSLLKRHGKDSLAIPVK